MGLFNFLFRRDEEFVRDVLIPKTLQIDRSIIFEMWLSRINSPWEINPENEEIWDSKQDSYSLHSHAYRCINKLKCSKNLKIQAVSLFKEINSFLYDPRANGWECYKDSEISGG